MKYKHTIIILLLLTALSNQLTAQKTSFGFETGYGTYQMTEIKQLLETSMSSNVLQPQCTSNFPGYIYFRPYVVFEYRNFNIGVAYTLMSTGARYSIHDYSGDYKLDAQIVGNAVGLFLELPLYTNDKLKFFIAAEGGIIYNKINIKEILQLNDIGQPYYDHNNSSLTSKNIFAKPYLKAEYKIAKNINSTISIGYHKDITQNVADWDGIRAGIGISYKFE
jgi:hypothetical protein